MDENREFKIDLHTEDANDDLNSTEGTEAFDKQVKQTTKASMLFVVFTFIAVGIILFILYYNLNSKIQIINTQGSAGIASLSNEFNDKLSEFSQQFSDQQETTQALLSDLDAHLKKLNSSVSAIQTGKLDKKDLADAVKGIKKELSPLEESIKSLNEQFAGIDDETQRIAESLMKVQTGVLNNNKEISTLDAIHIDRVYFDQELKKEREFNQQNMAHASEALFSEIATLHQLIKNLEKKLVHTNIPSSQKSNTTKAPPANNPAPQPGEIVEQEID
ncbi:MAG: hypothetical protein HF978_20570 [Desulfobacteraceae bacterium]|nr:hypothetical protein [Desulfobacteraceae bacterium]MBC2757943.1 hypothetical protein [Desulfobacteraceae bacterium]